MSAVMSRKGNFIAKFIVQNPTLGGISTSILELDDCIFWQSIGLKQFGSRRQVAQICSIAENGCIQICIQCILPTGWVNQEPTFIETGIPIISTTSTYAAVHNQEQFYMSMLFKYERKPKDKLRTARNICTCAATGKYGIRVAEEQSWKNDCA